MLTASGCKLRRQRLWERLNPRPDVILIADPRHLVYLANSYQSPFVFRSQGVSPLLVLGADGSATLIADNLLQPFCDQAHVDEVIAPTWYRCIESPPERLGFLVKNTLEQLARHPGSHVGLELSQVPAGVMEGLRGLRKEIRCTDVGPVLAELRRQEDEDELALLRLSMQAGEAGMVASKDIRPGMTELEAYLRIQRAALERLGEQAIVYGDFVSGPRCEQGGGPPSLRKIEAGDLVLVDFSTVVFGYRADFANTFVCGGSPSARQRELAQTCLNALAAGEKVLRAGVPGREVDRAVRAVFEKAGLGPNFPHHTGHGIGLGHPEPPFLVPESADTLLAGDVITLEPGVFVAGVAGMRFERNYLIRRDGYELLSRHHVGLHELA